MLRAPSLCRPAAISTPAPVIAPVTAPAAVSAQVTPVPLRLTAARPVAPAATAPPAGARPVPVPVPVSLLVVVPTVVIIPVATVASVPTTPTVVVASSAIAIATVAIISVAVTVVAPVAVAAVAVVAIATPVAPVSLPLPRRPAIPIPVLIRTRTGPAYIHTSLVPARDGRRVARASCLGERHLEHATSVLRAAHAVVRVHRVALVGEVDKRKPPVADSHRIDAAEALEQAAQLALREGVRATRQAIHGHPQAGRGVSSRTRGWGWSARPRWGRPSRHVRRRVSRGTLPGARPAKRRRRHPRRHPAVPVMLLWWEWRCSWRPISRSRLGGQRAAAAAVGGRVRVAVRRSSPAIVWARVSLVRRRRVHLSIGWT